jgi:nucleotide-binding universal stress UspA family protein
MKSGQILVHVETGQISEARLRYALSLAHNREAKLIGIAVRVTPAVAASVAISDAQAIAALCEASAASCQSAKALFDRVTTGCGIETEWVEAAGSPADAVAAEAGRADLAIIGQNDRDDPDGGMYRLQPADVIMASGTPVLVVPAQAPLTFKARRIMLAWKSTAQSARAAHAVLPLLAHAECVVLTEIVSAGENWRHEISAQSMANYLASHEITVSVKRVPAAGDAGDQLILAADDTECDLIVAGAYGHSRMREWALGGVTRTLLAAAPLPCIFSH